MLPEGQAHRDSRLTAWDTPTLPFPPNGATTTPNNQSFCKELLEQAWPCPPQHPLPLANPLLGSGTEALGNQWLGRSQSLLTGRQVTCPSGGLLTAHGAAE